VPILTLLALAFVPVWEIAQVGRQLADTFATTQRLHAVHAGPLRPDGRAAGSSLARRRSRP
jgi:ATP-binding cassette subfamily C protein CydCD